MSDATAPAPLSAPLFCSYCGQPVTITYTADPRLDGFWVCPAVGCAAQNRIAGVRQVVRVESRAAKRA